MNTQNQNISDKAIFSLFSGDNSEIVANPFGLLAQMRSTSAVMPLPFPIAGADRRAWMITRMQEAVQMLKDQAHFTVDPSSIGVEGLFGRNSAEADDTPTFFTSKTMLTVDEPDHRRLRLLVSKAFTPKYIESLRPQVQQIADELLDRVQDQGQMDLVADYAFPLPINVISEMLGVPHADRDQIRGWSEALAHGLGVGKRDPGVQANMRAFGEYVAHLVAEKRQRPADDLISQMIAIEEEGDRLSETELLSTITLLIFAGHETTSNLIATGTFMLLEHPDQLEQLKADLSLVPSAVEELLRFNGPATIAGPRFAIEDIELAGQSVKKGDVLFAVLASANRDEAQFTEPEELDIARTLNRHIAFGQGIHTCLGAPLARLEGDIAFSTLLRRIPNLHLSVPRESVIWNFSLNSRSLAALPVAF
ncbi:polyketide biosynthesis cytochrome P450 PksS [Reticulibacter mediterranei]|uniref:Polyketide biosynthesis cytochrome P450 PksS n=1 Tax=Reticulibacter mediterranei TaxID=2778369 RepID=A0A8J3IRX3_9CHLR|nr:cytochrome P450 [Reticulibacter mediterranei]GHO99656.1 polyketide biosynthesis cytochrome P450 PksS [Reticulibacter mediterranei]